MAPPDDTTEPQRASRRRLVLAIVAVALGALGVIAAGAQPDYTCRTGLTRAIPWVLFLVLVEIPAAAVAIGASRLRPGWKVTFIALVLLATPAIGLLWLVSAMCG